MLGLSIAVWGFVVTRTVAQANRRLQLDLAKLRQSQFRAQPDQLTTPPTKRPRSSDASTRTKASKPKPVVDESDSDTLGGGDSDRGDQESGSDDDEPQPSKSKVKKPVSEIPETSEAAEARLRRICEKKPSGKMHVTPEVHEQWARGGASRAKLLKQLQDVGFNKDTQATSSFQIGLCTFASILTFNQFSLDYSQWLKGPVCCNCHQVRGENQYQEEPQETSMVDSACHENKGEVVIVA